MGAVSKQLFQELCSDVSCDMLLHPWQKSCWKAAGPLFWDSMFGSAKFYAIVYLAQIVMRGKKMRKKEQWVKMGEYYLRSTLLGIAVCASGPSISCIIRRLIGGKFTYYTWLFIPFAINGFFIYLEPPSRRSLVINLFCNLLIELYLRQLKMAGYLSLSITQQTLLFMLGSAVLFYLMRVEGDKKERTPLFWLFTPEKVRRKSDNTTNICPHDGACLKYIGKGFRTYFAIGLGISLAKLILPRISSPIKAISSIRGKHFKLGLFIGSYIGIYRAVVCFLCRKQGYDSAMYALPAGYAAGLSYILNPSLGLAIASATAAFKLYSTILYEKKILPSNIPLPELLYCFCQGALFHAKVLHPQACPGYVHNIMKTVSGGRTEMIIKVFSELTRGAM